MAAKSKFFNKKTVIDGFKFDSQKEAAHYCYLKARQHIGQISDLKLQVRFPLKMCDKLICHYVADFTYIENGVLIIEDVKSAFTKKNPVYRLKKKMMLVSGYEIKEV